MAINRFYSPQRSQYVSQFVPDRLPAELMMGVLGSKQDQENRKQEFIGQHDDFRVDHIESAKADHARALEIEKQVRDAGESLMGVDITQDPQALSRYKKLIKDTQHSEDVKTLGSMKSLYGKHLENRAKIFLDPAKRGQGEGFFGDDATWGSYMTSDEGYSKKDWIFGTASEVYDTEEHINKALKEVKDSGYSIGDLTEFYHTLNAKSEVSAKHLEAVFGANVDMWMDGPIGAHLRQRAQQKLGLNNNELSEALQNKEGFKEEFTKVMDSELANFAKGVIARHIRVNTKTNITDRSNQTKRGDFEKDQKLGVSGLGDILEVNDAQKVIDNYDKNKNALAMSTEKLSKVTGIPLADVTGGTNGVVDVNVVMRNRKAVAKKLHDMGPDHVDYASTKELYNNMNALSHQLTIDEGATGYAPYVARAAREAKERIADVRKYATEAQWASSLAYDEGIIVEAIIRDEMIARGKDPKEFNSLPPTMQRAIREGATKRAKAIDSDFRNYGKKISNPNDESVVDAGAIENDAIKKWQENYAYNAKNNLHGQGVAKTTQDAGLSTPKTRELTKSVKEGIPHRVETKSGKTVNLLDFGKDASIVTSLNQLDENGNPYLVITSRVDKDGNYFDPESGETLKDTDKALQTKTTYVKDASSAVTDVESAQRGNLTAIINQVKSEISSGSLDSKTLALHKDHLPLLEAALISTDIPGMPLVNYIRTAKATEGKPVSIPFVYSDSEGRARVNTEYKKGVEKDSYGKERFVLLDKNGNKVKTSEGVDGLAIAILGIKNKLEEALDVP
jgi:hypothetical protein